mgnify:CR=1 FL=1
MKIKSNKIRASAKDQPCTLQIAGVCCHDWSTTVLAHLPDESNGMGTKSDDISACYACRTCHDAIDGRSNVDISGEDKEFYMRRAQTRTIRALIKSGLITLDGQHHHN